MSSQPYTNNNNNNNYSNSNPNNNNSNNSNNNNNNNNNNNGNNSNKNNNNNGNIPNGVDTSSPRRHKKLHSPRRRQNKHAQQSIGDMWFKAQQELAEGRQPRICKQNGVRLDNVRIHVKKYANHAKRSSRVSPQDFLNTYISQPRKSIAADDDEDEDLTADEGDVEVSNSKSGNGNGNGNGGDTPASNGNK